MNSLILERYKNALFETFKPLKSLGNVRPQILSKVGNQVCCLIIPVLFSGLTHKRYRNQVLANRRIARTTHEGDTNLVCIVVPVVGNSIGQAKRFG